MLERVASGEQAPDLVQTWPCLPPRSPFQASNLQWSETDVPKKSAPPVFDPASLRDDRQLARGGAAPTSAAQRGKDAGWCTAKDPKTGAVQWLPVKQNQVPAKAPPTVFRQPPGPMCPGSPSQQSAEGKSSSPPPPAEPPTAAQKAAAAAAQSAAAVPKLKAAPLKSPPAKKAAPTLVPGAATPPKKPAPELKQKPAQPFDRSKVKGAYPWTDAPPTPAQPKQEQATPEVQNQPNVPHQPVTYRAHTAGKRSSHVLPPKAFSQAGMPAGIQAHHLPQHPHVAQGWTIYAQTMQGPNLEECRHLMAGGLTPYTNQHGSGY